MRSCRYLSINVSGIPVPNGGGTVISVLNAQYNRQTTPKIVKNNPFNPIFIIEDDKKEVSPMMHSTYFDFALNLIYE